jgi:hypothetical protein
MGSHEFFAPAFFDGEDVLRQGRGAPPRASGTHRSDRRHPIHLAAAAAVALSTVMILGEQTSSSKPLLEDLVIERGGAQLRQSRRFGPRHPASWDDERVTVSTLKVLRFRPHAVRQTAVPRTPVDFD